jgi:hypothetical protein
MGCCALITAKSVRGLLFQGEDLGLYVQGHWFQFHVWNDRLYLVYCHLLFYSFWVQFHAYSLVFCLVRKMSLNVLIVPMAGIVNTNVKPFC